MEETTVTPPVKEKATFKLKKFMVGKLRCHNVILIFYHITPFIIEIANCYFILVEILLVVR